ncbi:MAG: lamin tail domain-containing protein, partial [Calditrichia bacterium]
LPETLPQGVADSLLVEVRNTGAQPQTDVPVRFFEDGVQVGTDVLVSLDAGQRDTLAFAYQPQTSGQHLLKAGTFLSGDENSANDFHEKNVQVLAAHAVPFADDFESSASLQNYALQASPQGQISLNDAFNMFTGPYSGDSVLALRGPADEVANMVTASFDVSQISQARLSFAWGMNWNSPGDYLVLDIFDGQWHQGVDSLVYLQSRGNERTWHYREYDLSGYDLSSTIGVRFRSKNNYNRFSYIDLLKVTEIASNDYAVREFVDFHPVMVTGNTYRFSARLENLGTAPQTDVPVRFFSSEVQIGSDSLVSLNPGQSDTVDFYYTPQQGGTRYLSVRSYLPGDQDSTNNSIMQEAEIKTPHSLPFAEDLETPASLDNFIFSYEGARAAFNLAGPGGQIIPISGMQMLQISNDNVMNGRSRARADLHLDLSAAANPEISFALAAYLLEADDSAAVDIFDGAWHYEVLSLTGTQSMAQFTFNVNSEGWNKTADFIIRFRANLDQGPWSDGFYVDNISAQETALPLPPVQISEIMYNPSDQLQGPDSDFEFVELANPSADTVDISGWYFSAGIDFVFPAGSMIEPNGFAVVGINPDSLVAFYNLSTVYGPFSGGLSNSGEALFLLDSTGAAIDSVQFDDQGPWPLDADGYGASLEVADLNLPNSDPGNWRASLALTGSPGQPNQVAPAMVQTTIHDIQFTTDPSGDSPLLGQYVGFSGKISSAQFVDGGIIVMDSAAAWNGIQVLSPDTTLQLGDSLQVTGNVIEYFGRTMLISAGITVNGSGTAVTPVQVVPAQVASGSPQAEGFESVLVQLQNVVVSDENAGYGEWRVTDFADTIMVDNGSYSYAPVLNDFLSELTGVLNYSFDEFKIAPRSDADIVSATAQISLSGIVALSDLIP